MKNTIKNIKLEDKILWLEVLKDEKISKEKYILNKSFFQNRIIQKITELNIEKENFFPCYADDRRVILIVKDILKNQTAEFVSKNLKIKTVCYFSEKENFEKTAEKFFKILKNNNTEQIKEIFQELKRTEETDKKEGKMIFILHFLEKILLL